MKTQGLVCEWETRAFVSLFTLSLRSQAFKWRQEKVSLKKKKGGGKAKEESKWMKGGLLNNQSSQVPISLGDLS